MAVALKGNLDDFGIAEIFQLIGLQRKTGLLEVEGPSASMRVAFDGGALAWAAPMGKTEYAPLGNFLVRCGFVEASVLEAKLRESSAAARPLTELLLADDLVDEEDIEEVSGLMTRETLFDLMRMTGGSFEFLARPVVHDRPPEKLMVAEQILMDGMRMQDEWQTFADELPAETAVLEGLGSVDNYCQRLDDGGQGGSERVRLVFHFVNGEHTVRQIIDLARLGTFTGSRILTDLRRAGLLEPQSPALRPKGRRRRRMGARVAEFGRLVLAAGLPILLLGGVTAGLVIKGLDSARARSVAYSPLEDARAQFARQRLHNLLEARRHGTGRWPHGLSSFSSPEGEPGGGLTGESAHAYYYMRRGDGIVLLAPRR